MKFCPSCLKNVSPIKRFNWAVFLLLCITMIGGIFYLVWYIIKPKNRCPICGCKVVKKDKIRPNRK